MILPLLLKGSYHEAQFASDVAVALRKLLAVPAHVVGLSMGGRVAFELPASAPRLVRSLVVTDDARHAVPVERPEAYNALVDGFLKRPKQSTAEHPAQAERLTLGAWLNAGG